MGVFSHIISWDALADSRVRWDDLAERRMEPALKPIHRLSQIWGQTEHRDSGPPGYATRNKIHRIMVEGPNGAAYSGPASPAKWGVEMEIFEHCFQLLPEYEYQQRFYLPTTSICRARTPPRLAECICSNITPM